MATAPALGHPLTSSRVDSFAGGLDVKTTPLRLSRLKAANRLTRADNCVLTTEGGVTKRFGKVAINTLTLGAAVTIVGGIQFRLSSGTDYQVVGTTDGRVVRINTDGTTANLATGKSTNAAVRYRFATYNDILHITNGFDAPMTWDGTTFANMAGSPPATGQVVVMHGNRAFMTARAVPSRLYWSKLNNTLDWTGTTDAGFMDVEPNDNSTIIDLVSSIQELVILKGRRPYRLQGIGPVTGYTVADHLVPTTGSVGAISTQGAVFALNDVYYISELGLHSLTQTQQFGDLKEAFLSDRVEPYFRLDSAYSLLLEHLATSVVAYDSQANNLYLCVDGTAQYDPLVNGNFEQWDSPTVATGWSISGGNLAKDTTHAHSGAASASFTGAGSLLYQNLVTAQRPVASWFGRTITVTGWVRTTLEVSARLFVEDGVSPTYSPYHSGSGLFERLTVTHTVALTATHVFVGGVMLVATTPAQYDDLVVEAVDTIGGRNDTMLVYDLVLKAWTVWVDTPYASLFTVRNATTGAREVWGGGYDGFVYALTRSSGSIEPVSGRVSHITDLHAPGMEKSLRYGFFYFATEDVATVQITTSFDFGASGGQTYTVDLAAGAILWDAATWDLDLWDTSNPARTGIIRLDMSGLGEVVETTVQNLEPAQAFTLLGYELFYRDRRRIRRPRSL